MKRPGIYRVWNVVNGKSYIGSSRDVVGRLAQHQATLVTGQHDNDHLQNSFHHYGAGAFQYTLIECCSKDQLLQREQLWINYFQSADERFGYNICGVAGSRLGTTFKCPQSSAFHRGRPKSEAQKERMRQAHLLDWSSPGPKREALKQKLKATPFNQGKVHSIPTRAKMKIAARARDETNIQAGKDKYWQTAAGQAHMAKLRAANERRRST